MPRVAALLDVPAVSDVMAVESPARFRRPIYAGNAIVTVEVDARPVVATVRTASFSAVAPHRQAPRSKRWMCSQRPWHIQGLSKSRRPRAIARTCSPRACVVSGGRALGSAEKFQLIYQLADALGAAVGASRAAVDAGYAPNDLQVGQTGKIIAPELYVALGISGAIQHLTGIKDARAIVAINKDRGRADLRGGGFRPGGRPVRGSASAAGAASDAGENVVGGGDLEVATRLDEQLLAPRRSRPPWRSAASARPCQNPVASRVRPSARV